VSSSKGGVGKSTFSVQFLAPFLYEKSKATKKVKVFEVDPENDSSGAFNNTVVFDSTLITSIKQFSKIINTEIGNLSRDYPIIIDVGVGHYHNAIEALSELIIDEKVNFIVPSKASQDDYNNSIITIKDIKRKFKNHNIILVCSDALSSHSKEDKEDLLDEFGWIFGRFNMTTGEVSPSIFKQLNFDEKYIVIKASDILDKCTGDFGITVYESTKVDFNELLKQRESAHNLFKKASKEEKVEAQRNYDIARMKIQHLKKYSMYADKYILSQFRQFEMSL
jgi:hypothetical protein